MAHRATAIPWHAMRLAPVPVMLALVAVTVSLPHPGVPPTTYAAVSSLAHAADLAAGLGLLAAGLVGWLDVASRRLGALAMFAALAWFAPDWEGWRRGAPLVVSLAAAASPVFLVLVLHVLLAAPRGRVRSRAAHTGLVLAYAAAFAVALERAVLRDPVLDPYCWRNCLENVFLVHGEPGVADAVERAWLVAAAAAGALAVAFAFREARAATAPARRARLPLVVPAAAVAATEGLYALALLRDRYEDPAAGRFEAVYAARCAAVLALAAGIVATVMRDRRVRASVGRLARDLGEAPPPGTLRAALSAAIGDPTVEVSYRLTGSHHVGADGLRVEAPVTGDGRAATPIVREGKVVAVVSHDASLLDGTQVERQIGSATRLAIENERLQAEVLARLVELRASRARIVERGDAERRRLERNLHDGAQQRLLALAYDLRLARSAAATGREAGAERLLGHAERETHEALDELRVLARGIFPSVLSEAGLRAALASLADESPVAVEPGEIAGERFPAPVETAAYVTLGEAIEDAAARGATYVAVEVVRRGDVLHLTARDDGSPRHGSTIRAGDRIGALGGAVTVAATTLGAEIPCG